MDASWSSDGHLPGGGGVDRAPVDRRSVRDLCLALGVVFVWFGALKLFPGVSPAEELVGETVGWIVERDAFLRVLAVWEVAIGLGLLLGRRLRLTLCLLGAHMAGTFLPLVCCPEQVWSSFPFVLTLEGQYIVKNLVLIAAGMTVAASLGGRAAATRGDGTRGSTPGSDGAGPRRRGPSAACPSRARSGGCQWCRDE